jgi:2'-5' RNA ligase
VLSALVIEFPESGAAVEEWRERTCKDKPSIGIPAHVTLLFPFLPPDQIGDEVLSELRALFAATTPFEVGFRESRRWPRMVYLAPEPPEPFIGLTEEIVERWPDYPPYEGLHDSVIPHLTVAYGDDALLAEVEADIGSALPIQAVVREATLLEEIEPDWGRWRTRAGFPLGR